MTSDVIARIPAPRLSMPLTEARPIIFRREIEMRRREFVRVVTSTLASGALTGCIGNLRGSRVALGNTQASVASARVTMSAADFHAARQYARTSFGKIAYVERGAGDAALFLHGFPLNGFQWRGALERLSAHRRCIALDFLAMGYSEVADGQSVAPGAQVAMLVALLDTLSIRRVDLVANDSGGAVAQLLVARHPELVRTLLLTNCDTEIDSPPPALTPVIELSKAGRYVDEWLVPWLANKELARSAEGIGGMCYSNPNHPTDEAIEYYLAPLVSSAKRKAQVHAYAIALERNSLEGIQPLLRRSTVPTRIVWGTADDIFKAASPDYLDRSFGNSRGMRRLAGRKLFFPEEVPDIIAEEACRLWGIA
jgi:pimeloyl-ACP methyl ester carboxylesterase